jgi:outer membrane lipoprotein-sorting protein
MKKTALAASPLAFLLAFAAWPGAAQDENGDGNLPPAPSQPQPVPAAEREAVLGQVDEYLEDLDVMTGSFFQIEPSGVVSEGQFWIDRPGRMRFEYGGDNPYTLISDGANYIVWDSELEEVNTCVALRQTPLNIFLKNNVDLERDADVLGLSRTSSELLVTLKDHDDRVEGTLTLVFAQPALELRRFATTNEAGERTEIVLTETVRGGSVEASRFVVRGFRARDLCE